jgi:hypothetical protein
LAAQQLYLGVALGQRNKKLCEHDTNFSNSCIKIKIVHYKKKEKEI